MDWRALLSPRERAELELADYYATCLRHGTDGHHRLLLLAKLAKALDYATSLGGNLGGNELPGMVQKRVHTAFAEHVPLGDPQNQEPCR